MHQNHVLVHTAENSCISKSPFGVAFFSKKIAMPAEYSPSALNVHVDWESGSIKDNSEWELNVSVYQEIGTYIRKQTLDLFASKHCH